MNVSPSSVVSIMAGRGGLSSIREHKQSAGGCEAATIMSSLVFLAITLTQLFTGYFNGLYQQINALKRSNILQQKNYKSKYNKRAYY